MAARGTADRRAYDGADLSRLRLLPAEALASWPKWLSSQRKQLLCKDLARWSTSATGTAQRGRSGDPGQRLAARAEVAPANQRAIGFSNRLPGNSFVT